MEGAGGCGGIATGLLVLVVGQGFLSGIPVFFPRITGRTGYTYNHLV